MKTPTAPSKASIGTILHIAFALFLLAGTSVLALTVNVPAGAETATIQNAIDQVSAARGGAVNLAAGTYSLTASLIMKSNVTLNGAGNPATCIRINGDFAAIQPVYEGLSNLTIQNMSLAGSGVAVSSSCQGIILSATAARNFYFTNIQLNNVQVMNCGGMGVQIERANGVTITNCNFHDNAGFDLMDNLYLRHCNSVTMNTSNCSNSPNGTGLKVSGVCRDITINGSTFSNNGLQGVNVLDVADNVTLQNNRCNGNGRHDSKQGDGIAFFGTNGLIDSNTCANNTGAGIHTLGGYGTVSKNSVTGNTGGSHNLNNGFTLPVNALTVNVPAGAATAAIQNAIDQVSAAGGGTVNLAAGTYSLTAPIKMKSNVTLNGAGTPATSIAITGNFTGIGHASEGLCNLTVQNLKLVGSGVWGSTNCHGIIFASGNAYFTNIKVSNVEISDCGGMGMHIKRANGIKILNCNFHNNAGFNWMHNLYLYNCNSAFMNGSKSTGSPWGMGLHLNGVNNNITVIGNTFSNNAGFGIYAQTTDRGKSFKVINVTLQNNICNTNGNSSGAHSDGISFSGINGRIDSNTCANNVAAGIRTWGSSNGTISNNTAIGNPAGNYVIGGWFAKIKNH